MNKKLEDNYNKKNPNVPKTYLREWIDQLEKKIFENPQKQNSIEDMMTMF